MTPRTDTTRANPKSRWHSEGYPHGRHAWACIPITDAVQAEAEAVRDALTALRAEVEDPGRTPVVDEWYSTNRQRTLFVVERVSILAAIDRALGEP
jgi:hypothetical protein